MQAVCVWCGVSDFMTIDKAPGAIKVDQPDGVVARLFGGPMSQKLALAKQASPITYINKDNPPFLLMHGEKDTTIPASQSEALFAALTKAGVPAKFVPFKDTGHPIDRPDRRKVVYEFFNEVLKKDKGGGPASRPES